MRTHADADAVIRRLVHCSGRGGLRACAGAPTPGDAGVLGPQFWHDLHECIYRGAGQATIDLKSGTFVVDCRRPWQRGEIVHALWFAGPVMFRRADLPIDLDPTRDDGSRSSLFAPDAHQRLPSDGPIEPGSLDAVRGWLVGLIAHRPATAGQ